MCALDHLSVANAELSFSCRTFPQSGRTPAKPSSDHIPLGRLCFFDRCRSPTVNPLPFRAGVIDSTSLTGDPLNPASSLVSSPVLADRNLLITSDRGEGLATRSPGKRNHLILGLLASMVRVIVPRIPREAHRPLIGTKSVDALYRFVVIVQFATICVKTASASAGLGPS
jgi:hypothetical protein